MVSVPRTRLLRASPIGRVRPSRSIWTSKSAIARGFRRPLEVNVLGQLCAGQRLTDSVVTDVGDLAQRSAEHTSELQSLIRIPYSVFSLTKKNKHLSPCIFTV